MRRTIRTGVASWYDDGPGLYAALPGWNGVRRQLEVRRAGYAGPCVRRSPCRVVTVRDWCQCYVHTSAEKVIDLSPAAFAALAPLSRGIVRVEIGGVSR